MACFSWLRLVDRVRDLGVAKGMRRPRGTSSVTKKDWDRGEVVEQCILFSLPRRSREVLVRRLSQVMEISTVVASKKEF